MISVTFYSNLKCAGGLPIAVAKRIVDYNYEQRVDNVDALQLIVPWDEHYLYNADETKRVGIGKWIRVIDVSGEVVEWRISDISDVKAAADGATVTITAEPAMSVLGTLGIVDDPSATSDYPIYNNGLTNATPYQYLSTYLVPWFTAQGITWIAIGNVDFTTRLNFAWSEGTALHVIQEITTLSENEFSFRRNGDSGYYIDIEPARNISENPRLVSVGRNMVWLSRQRRIAPLKTVILAKGAVPQGAVEVSTFAENAWLVTAVSSNDITLADPATGQPGPFRFNNQCVNNYILKKDGTYTQISATSATTQIATVASATGIAVGDHVSVRRTNTGKYLTLLTNPAAVTKYGTFVGVASRDTYRGERNYIAGGALPAWTQNAHTNSMIAAQVVGTESTPGDVTIALKSAPVGAQINAGDVLLNIDTLAVPTQRSGLSSVGLTR
jgi:hypothetical protein